MGHPKFDTNEDYCRWFENKQEKKIINDYFGNDKVIKEWEQEQ